MRRFAIPIQCELVVLFCFTATAAARPESPSAPSPASPALQLTEEEAPKEAEEKPTDESAKDDADSEKKNDAESNDKEGAEESPAKDEDKPAEKDADTKKPEATDESAKEKPPEKAEEKPKAKKRETLTIEPKRLKIELPLDGTFVARKLVEVPLRPDAWTDFEIVEVVEHGAKVHKGEVLMKFDDEKLNEAIADLELEQRLNELAILRSEEEMPRMEKTLKMDFDDADRSNRQAKEDFVRYNEIDRPMMVKSAEFMVKYYNFSLDYEKDELDQLEKMYEADDLTEETEEVVLKRQRNAVEFAEFSLENARINRDEVLNIRLPRSDIQIKESLERAALALARAQTALSLDLNRARYELEQRKKARTKSLDRHAKLLADRELMQIKAPADGIVFYGQSVNGRWSDTQTLINKYKPHSNVAGGSILMTIVESRPLFVTTTVEEAKRPDLAVGQAAKVALPAEESDRIPGELKSISPIPVSSGKFDVNFDVEQDKIPDWVVAGMSCKVHVNTYDKKDAIVVPKKAVHDDEDDPDQRYVWIVDPKDESAKPERRDVKLGKRKGDEVEVLKGLAKGDVISLDDESEKEKKKE